MAWLRVSLQCWRRAVRRFLPVALRQGWEGGGGGGGVRLGGEQCSGGRVSTGKGIIYQGNTIRTIGSTTDCRKELGYLGHMGFFAYHFLFLFLFLFSFCCTIVK
jgi:hypothetical protein